MPLAIGAISFLLLVLTLYEIFEVMLLPRRVRRRLRFVRAYFLVTQVTEPPVTEIRHSCYARDTVQLVDGQWRFLRRKIDLNSVETVNEYS